MNHSPTYKKSIIPASISFFSNFILLFVSSDTQRNQEALEIMEQAISADKQNPLPVYQKANILVSLERYDEALKELDQLSESAPHESSIYALMGKIYKRLEMHEKAMFYFGLALDLKPPAADVATIKVLIPIFIFCHY